MCFIDTLVKKLEELERNEFVYKGLAEHTKLMLRAFYNMCQVYRGLLHFILYFHFYESSNEIIF